MRLRDRGQKRESAEAGVVTSTPHAEPGHRLRKRRGRSSRGQETPRLHPFGRGRTASADQVPTSGYKLLIY